MKSVEIEIPIRTYLLALTVFVLTYFVIQLAPVIILLFLSLLIAITLNSVERYLVSKGWNKKVADVFLVLGLIGMLALITFVVIPKAVTQMQEVLVHLPRLKAELMKMAPPAVSKSANEMLNESPSSMGNILGYLTMYANSTLTAIFEVVMLFIVAIYMFLDGKRTYNWILAFFPENVRRRIDRTAVEISPIVQAYIIGQATTSTIAAIWVYTAATIFEVPGAMTLAVLAAIFDILPGIGFLLNIFSGAIFALTVSTHTALLMVVTLMAYTALENYLLIPLIYGNRLKLSPLVVLTSLIVSGAIAGVPGMIAILPLVAAYGPIERHWLKRQPGMEETVAIHQSENAN